MKKFISKFFKIKNDIPSLIFVILTSIVALFAIFLVLYDLIWVLLVVLGGKFVSNFFVVINIIGIVLGVCDLIYFIVLIILNMKTVKSK